MTRPSLVPAAVAAFALLTVGGSAAIAQTKTTTNTAQCFVDDGYGRIRSCSQRYRRDNPNWRGTEHCYVDEGNGRYRSCAGSAANFKRKRPKS
jgi:hypothetical protein